MAATQIQAAAPAATLAAVDGAGTVLRRTVAAVAVAAVGIEGCADQSDTAAMVAQASSAAAGMQTAIQVPVPAH
jgi:hypothetical protein